MQNSNTKWYILDLLHHEGGFAIEWKNGNTEWYNNGLYHRENGPAVELKNGTFMEYDNIVFIERIAMIQEIITYEI